MLAYFATHEKYKRNIPGRIIGVTKDADGNRALRMALTNKRTTYKKRKSNIKYLYGTGFISGYGFYVWSLSWSKWDSKNRQENTFLDL